MPARLVYGILLVVAASCFYVGMMINDIQGNISSLQKSVVSLKSAVDCLEKGQLQARIEGMDHRLRMVEGDVRAAKESVIFKYAVGAERALAPKGDK